jgi:hypothetical protein
LYHGSAVSRIAGPPQQVWIDGEQVDLSNRNRDLYERCQQRLEGH